MLEPSPPHTHSPQGTAWWWHGELGTGQDTSSCPVGHSPAPHCHSLPCHVLPALPCALELLESEAQTCLQQETLKQINFGAG